MSRNRRGEADQDRACQQANRHLNSPPSPALMTSYDIRPTFPVKVRESLPPQPVEVARLREVPGQFEPDRRNQSRRCEVGSLEIRPRNRDPDQRSAGEVGAAQGGIGKIRLL